MIFKSDGSQGDLNGFLDAGSHIQGELHFENAFRIDGRLTGKVVSSGDLVIGDRGEVDGEVRVGRVLISGTARGKVQALHKVAITPTGKVYASLETPSLVVEDGGFIEGRCSMVRQAKSGPKAVAPIPISTSQR